MFALRTFVLAALLATDAGAGRQITNQIHNVDRDSWHTTIQVAVNYADPGDMLVVYPGVYTGSDNRDIYAGGCDLTIRSVDPNDPNIVAATIIDVAGEPNDPHQGFVLVSGESAAMVLAGLTIANGYAEVGGGLDVRSGSAATVRRCVFRDNHATTPGGAVHISDAGSHVTFEDCVFSDNCSDDWGGAVRVQLDAGAAFRRCRFERNSANVGGALATGESSIDNACVIEDCDFVENYGDNGGALHVGYGFADVVRCTFLRNLGERGGACKLWEGSQATFSDCSFERNTAMNTGGAVYAVLGSAAIFNNCAFEGNASENGGAMEINDSAGTISNSLFFANFANWAGAVRCRDAEVQISRCHFLSNTAVDDGGAVAGGLGSTVMLTDSVLAGNFGWAGSAINVSGQMQLTLRNCTVTGNTAADEGAIKTCADGHALIENSILWGNAATGRSPNLSLRECSSATVTHSVVGGVGDVFVNDCAVLTWGIGNLDADPLFVDARGPDGLSGTLDDNLHLLPTSPCIDAGDPNFVAAPGAADLDGFARIWDGDGDDSAIVDMGAYEFGSYRYGDLNCDGWVNNGDIDAFVFALSFPEQYPDEYPGCEVMLGDINGDGWMNNGDIDAFVTLLTGQ